MSYHAISHDECMRVLRLAAERARLDTTTLLHSREPTPSRWRWATMVVFRRAGYSFQAIGTVFGRDHSTVMVGVRKIEESEPLKKLADALAVDAKVTRFGAEPGDDAASLACDAEELARRRFDDTIAHIDRALSEVMIQAKLPQDDADTATLRHHAGDLILSGVAILKRLGRLDDLADYLPKCAAKGE